MPTNQTHDFNPDQSGQDLYSSPGRLSIQEPGTGNADVRFSAADNLSGNVGTDVNDAFLSDYGEDEINWEMSQADIDDGREG